jgi:nucleotide-binding universal stress UspA family protein
MSAIKKILVPLDFGDEARDTLAYAVLLARTLDACLVLYHVWEPPSLLPVQLLVASRTGGAPLDAGDLARARAEARLQELAAGSAPATRRTTSARSRPPVTSISSSWARTGAAAWPMRSWAASPSRWCGMRPARC